MNAIERLDAFLKGDDLDRLPVYPLMMRQAAKMAGIAYGKYCQDYKAQADSMMYSAEKLHAECVHPSGYPYCEARAYGLQVEYPEDDLPIAREHLIRKSEDFSVIRSLNPENYDFMMDRVRGIAYFKESKGDDLVICGHHEGILAEYSDLRGLGEACMDFFDIPEELHEYFEIIRENACRWGALQVEAGAHFMSIGDAACSQIGPDLYRDFIFPHHKKMVSFYHDLGARVKLHICGDISSLIPMLIETGADMIDVDHLVEDITPYLSLLKDHQLFCGNLNPVDIILNGRVNEIKSGAEKWIKDSGGRGIISGGCEIPVHTPDSQLEALARTGVDLLDYWKQIRQNQ